MEELGRFTFAIEFLDGGSDILDPMGESQEASFRAVPPVVGDVIALRHNGVSGAYRVIERQYRPTGVLRYWCSEYRGSGLGTN